MESEDLQTLFQVLAKFMMPFSFANHKGQSGRIAIIGGSKEYTGAPYFAGISSLKVGGDLVYIYSNNEAAPIIKSYSPELIVYPVLDKPEIKDQLKNDLKRCHSLIIGPGLGRSDDIEPIFQEAVYNAMQDEIPIVVDADGLYFLSRKVSMIRKYKYAFLTPNAREFERLYIQCFNKNPRITNIEDAIAHTEDLSRKLGNVTIIHKGNKDIITNGNSTLLCEEPNSPRRCGGQGDLLSGSLGTYAYWSKVAAETRPKLHVDFTILAGLAACMLTRRCNFLAFQKAGRSTTTTDMIAEIKNAISNDIEKMLHSVDL